MNKIPINWPGFNWEAGQPVISDFIEGLVRQVNEAVGRIFEAELNGDVERMLGRGAYERAGKGTGRVSAGRCPKCGSDYRADRVRNGYRTRHLLTAEWGELVVGVPRVCCRCGGSVPVSFPLWRAYQRFFADVGQTIRPLAADGLSLRQIQVHLSERLSSSVGLRTINAELHAIQQRVAPPLASVAPVLLLDAIWTKVLTPNGETRPDQRGRQRPVKRKHTVAVRIALAVWPESGQREGLDWELAPGEDADAWQALLARLEARGV
jgi:transposase-like protein